VLIAPLVRIGKFLLRLTQWEAAFNIRAMQLERIRRTSRARIFTLSALSFAAAVLPQAQGAGKADHVLIVVWDGMRPDFIRPQYTPTLSALAEKGVFFKNHHPVYVSSTEVNGTAIITGAYPDRSGIGANTDYRPEIRWLEAGGTEAIETVRRGDLLKGGHYIAVPTLPELVQASGHHTVIAGTKSVALLLDRSNSRESGAASKSVNLFKGQTLPRAALLPLVKVNDDKDFPTNITHPNTAQDAWTAKALTHGLWKSGVPRLSVLWQSDPDFSQHDSGPGSPAAIGGLESVDNNLKEVLKALDEKHVREKTDILVVSDHGFSTIDRGVDVAHLLRRGGFKATKKFEDPEPGDILVVGLGGSVALYVIGHDSAIVRKVVEFLQNSDFAGVIFSHQAVEGTFPLSTVRSDTSTAPDILVSLRWNSAKSEFGTPGLVTSEGGTKGKGTHASLSPFDMHNTLIAAGPDFRVGLVDELPTGNADLAPTIAWILGLETAHKMDGRVLGEALVNSPEQTPKAEQKTLEAAHDSALFRWRQYLKVKTVGSAIYFDEGSGESLPK